MRKIWIVSLMALATIAAASATAQTNSPQSAGEVLKRANAASSELEQLRQNLRSPDQSVRVSTFQAMIESNNPSLKEVAISEAFASLDEAMKTMAFRAAAGDLKMIKLEPAGLPPGQVYRNYEEFAEYLRFSLPNYDWRTGQFCQPFGTYGRCSLSGQFSGRTFTYRDDPGICSGVFQNIEGTWEFQGQVTCNPGGGRQGLMGAFQFRLR